MLVEFIKERIVGFLVLLLAMIMLIMAVISKEPLGFWIAFAICLVAGGVLVYTRDFKMSK